MPHSSRSAAPLDIVIVGGGASGVLVASHLLRAGVDCSVTLIEKTGRVGAGVAYATERAEHLLNVPAGHMSAFEDDPDHFVRFLGTHGSDGPSPDAVRSQYVQRRQFGVYLRATLQQTSGQHRGNFRILHDEVTALEPGRPHHLQLRSGARLQPDALVLALGNWPRGLPQVTPSLPHGSVLRGWDYQAVAAIAPASEVLIAGSGLSMVDAVLTLAANGHQGRIHVVSRHGLLPQPHAPRAAIDFDLDAFARLSLHQRLRHLRALARRNMAEGKPWQQVLDALRTHNVQLWQSLSDDDQRRFLRHAVRQWDVHRHRIPVAAAATLRSLLDSGRLQHHAAHIENLDGVAGRLVMALRPRHGGARILRADCLIDCLGMQPDIRRIANPVVQTMLANGAIRRGPHGIGLDTGADGAVLDHSGRVQPRLYTLGSVRIGSLWESVAIPELRKQAAAIVARLLADAAAGGPGFETHPAGAGHQ